MGASSSSSSSLSDADSLDKLIRKHYPAGLFCKGHSRPIGCKGDHRIGQMANTIRAKDNWSKMLRSKKIRNGWIVDAKSHGLSAKEIDYLLDELAYTSQLQNASTKGYCCATDTVWYIDDKTDIDTDLELKECVAALENDINCSAENKANEDSRMVVDLIDPMLYPLDYTCSFLLDKPITSLQGALQLDTFGKMPASFEAWKAAFPGAFISQPLEKDKSADGDNDNIDEDEDEYQVSMYSEDERVKTSSDRFCMLPTDFQVDKDGTTTIESYINNLHPVQYQKLYPVICKLFSKFLPAVEQVLTDMVYSRPRRIDTSRRWCDDDRTEYDSDLDDYRDDYASDDMSDERMAAWVKNKQYIGLEPEKFVAPERPLKPYSLRGRRLQAIVKMTNIELTPDNPVFYQKSWNIVGTVNERVIATGVYCYDMENIDHVYKQFREPMYGMHVYFRCFDGIGLYMMYGIERGENGDPLPASQPVGQIQIKKGRYFAFPNTYQYRDTEFKLKDPSKPGFCKLFILYYIDPSADVPSTSLVPPQQQSWWTDGVWKIKPLASLPSVIKKRIMHFVSYPISPKAASKIRSDIADEHATIHQNVNWHFERFHIDLV